MFWCLVVVAFVMSLTWRMKEFQTEIVVGWEGVIEIVRLRHRYSLSRSTDTIDMGNDRVLGIPANL